MHRHIATVALALAVLCTSTLASVDRVFLQVKGVACPFCVYGIEKNLKKVPGVAAVEMTIRTGVVRISLQPGTPLDAAALEEAITMAGFTPGSLEVQVTGNLVTTDDKPALKSEETGQVFLLVEPGEAGTHELLSAETLSGLKKASDDGAKPLTISGRVHRHAGMPAALAVERYRAAR